MTAVLAATSTTANPLWYFARGAGFVSLVMLAATVCFGLLAATRSEWRRWPVFALDELHRYLVVVYFVFLVLHVATVLLDPFTKFGLGDVLVPLASSYRRVWMALGIVAAELSLALALSVKIRRHIGYRAWRVLHQGTWVLFPASLVHGLATGTDTHGRLGLVIYGVCGAAVLLCTAVRLVHVHGRWRVLRVPAFGAAAAAACLTAAWTVHGPLAPGWARASGTPAQFLSGESTPSPAMVAATPVPSPRVGAPAGRAPAVAPPAKKPPRGESR